jgi:hypothetical protein
MMESILDFPNKYIRYYPGYTNSFLQGSVLPSYRSEEIYNIQKDPLEMKNLITEKELLESLREKMNQKSLLKNSFHILFPKEKNYTGYFSTKGEIYKVNVNGNLDYKFLNRFKVQFKKKEGEETEFRIYTTNPTWEFQLQFINQPNLYKIGKWQLPNGESREKVSKFLIAEEGTKPIDSHFPFLYNDGKLSKSTQSRRELGLSSEVKNILKSWGYIHE